MSANSAAWSCVSVPQKLLNDPRFTNHSDHHATRPQRPLSQLGSHNLPKNNAAFAIGVALNSVFIIAEVVYGLSAHSLALLSDAGHNLGRCAPATNRRPLSAHLTNERAARSYQFPRSYYRLFFSFSG